MALANAPSNPQDQWTTAQFRVRIRRRAERTSQPTTSTPSERGGERYALIVGVNRLSISGSHLRGAVNDAMAIANVVSDLWRIPSSNTYLLLDEQATRAAILDAWQTLIRQAEPGDELLFYFSGHGSYTPLEEPIIVPYDIGRDAEGKLQGGIRAEELRQFVDKALEIGADVTLILDADPGLSRYISGKAVILSSSGGIETTREQYITEAGTWRGVFSFFLEQVLRQVPSGTTWQEVVIEVQTQMKTQLSIAGHLTRFVPRTGHGGSGFGMPQFFGPPERMVWTVWQDEDQLARIPTVPYQIVLEPPAEDPVLIGKEYDFTLRLTPAPPAVDPDLRVPVNSLELTLFVEAAGFRQIGDRVHTLPVVDGAVQGRTLTLRLMPLLSGSRSVGVQIDPGGRVEGAGPRSVSCAVRVEAPALLPDIRELIDRRAIPAPQPDVMLYLSLAEENGEPEIRVHATAPALLMEQREVARLALTPADVRGLRQTAAQIAADTAAGPPDAVTIGLQTFGAALFDQLMPPGSDLRRLYRATSAGTAQGRPSWLIIADAEAILPWEMVLPYDEEGIDDFLGGQFLLTHWIGRQNFSLLAEMPLLKLNVAHYHQRPQDLPRWQTALGGEDLVHVESRSGHLDLLESGTLCYGLHLVRYMERSQPGRIATAIEENGQLSGDNDRTRSAIVYERRLDFSRRRPLVGLSFVDGEERSVARDNQIEDRWSAPLLHAGATALVAPRWPAPPQVDRVFFHTFYERLRDGATLGESLSEARLYLRRAYPHQPHWLAYVAFGHPHCRPYLVQTAQGFALFEVLDHPVDAPLQPGQRYRFRASYRTEVPGWYGGRLRRLPATFQGEEDDPLSVLVMPLDGSPPRQYPLELADGGDDCHCLVDLTMPAVETTLPVLVQFTRGGREVQTLTLNFEVREG